MELYKRYDGTELYVLLYVALLRSLLSSVLVTILEVILKTKQSYMYPHEAYKD